MKLYHATPKANLESIRATGLDPNRSTGKEAVVWLHTASRREWAIIHTTDRHKCEASDVIVIEVSVSRLKLRRRWRGLWTTPETITEFGRIRNASEFTQTPIQEIQTDDPTQHPTHAPTALRTQQEHIQNAEHRNP